MRAKIEIDYAIFNRYCDNEDLIQEAAIKLYQWCERENEVKPTIAMHRRCLRLALLDDIRYRKREKRDKKTYSVHNVFIGRDWNEVAGTEVAETDSFKDEQTPFDEAEQKDYCDWLREQIRDLPKHLREVVQLKLNGTTVKEAERRLGVCSVTFYNRLKLATAIIRKRIEDERTTRTSITE